MYYVGVKCDNSSIIVCDTLTRRIVKISDVDASGFNNDCLLFSSDIDKLLGDKYNEDFQADRRGLLERRFASIRESRVLNLTIAFSKKCNLACKYCYEQHDELGNHTIVIDTLCKFIIAYVKEHSMKQVHLELYGGEPLLHKAEIRSLLHFLELQHINFSLSMMTNGTLYDESFYSELIKSGLQKVEISVDGPERIHNFQRPMKNNQNCFKEIINTIELICNKVPVVIRVNTGRNNIDYIISLLEEFVRLDIHNKISIYFTPIINSPQAFSTKEEFSKIGQCYLEASKLGFNIPMRIYATGPCYLYENHSFAVLPDNSIRKCIAIPETIVGDTISGQLSPVSYQSVKKECYNCDLYPICFGGCQYGSGMCHPCPEKLFEGLLPGFLLGKEIAYERQKN